MSTRYGLPTDGELRRLTRRKIGGLAIALAVAVALVAVLAVTLDGIAESSALYVVGAALMVAHVVTTGDPAPRDLTRREVLTAGSRRRRRRLRWALLRGRTETLDDDDRRVCHYLARVVRVRSWVLLILNGGSLVAGSAFVAAPLSGSPPALPSLVVAVLVLLVVLTVADLGLRVAELKASGRYLARLEP